MEECLQGDDSVNDELVNEVEVVSDSNSDSGDATSTGVATVGEGESSMATMTTTPAASPSVAPINFPLYQNEMDLLVSEVRALKERMADLMKRVQERLAQEESEAAAWAANRAVNEPLEVVNTPTEAARVLLPSQIHPAVKRKSTTSKYSKKKRIVTPCGTARISRSLNVRQTTTIVGSVNLATAAYDDDEDLY
ncbi:hypothetical protein GE061_005591 [Apolygus lucorum]|uniref:Uncharacterized protein n=1 Tax=Apolygus lucorum TaxID=248454 RepID=A0A8S9WY30_APOLU|nr:hypothetical protein GE061_005591 [Apolygus lucorum]